MSPSIVHSGVAVLDLSGPKPPEVKIRPVVRTEVPNISALSDTAEAMELRPSGIYAPPQPVAPPAAWSRYLTTASFAPSYYVGSGAGYINWVMGGANAPAHPQFGGGAELPTEKREMPVIGFRAWGFSSKFRLGEGRNVALKSTGIGEVHWKVGDNHAECIPNKAHEAPNQFCSCGYYVLANLDELESHVQINDGTVVGAVMGWGRVVQHGTEGWRAEYARIVGLLDCKYSKGQLRNTQQAATAYDVEIYSRDAIETYLREWGDPFQG